MLLLGNEEVIKKNCVGAPHLVLNTCRGNLSLEPVSVVGVRERKENRPFFTTVSISVKKTVGVT